MSQPKRVHGETARQTAGGCSVSIEGRHATLQGSWDAGARGAEEQGRHREGRHHYGAHGHVAQEEEVQHHACVRESTGRRTHAGREGQREQVALVSDTRATTREKRGRGQAGTSR